MLRKDTRKRINSTKNHVNCLKTDYFLYLKKGFRFSFGNNIKLSII